MPNPIGDVSCLPRGGHCGEGMKAGSHSHFKQPYGQTGSSDDDDHACGTTLSLRQLAGQGAACLMAPCGNAQDAPMTQQYSNRLDATATNGAGCGGQLVDVDMWDTWAEQGVQDGCGSDEARNVAEGDHPYSPEDRSCGPSMQAIKAESERIKQINDDVVQVLIVIMTSVNESCKENETMHEILVQVHQATETPSPPPLPATSDVAPKAPPTTQLQPQLHSPQQQQPTAPPRTSVSGVCLAPLQRQNSAPPGSCTFPFNASNGPIAAKGGSATTRGRLSQTSPLAVLAPGHPTGPPPPAPPAPTVPLSLLERSRASGSAAAVGGTHLPAGGTQLPVGGTHLPAMPMGAAASAPASASSSPTAPSGSLPPNADPFWMAEHFWGSWGSQHVDMLIASCPTSTTVRKASSRGPRTLVRAISDVAPSLPALKVQCR